MNTEELKQKALAATPGPWAHGVTWIEHLGGIVALGNTARSKQDVAYVASANPSTILAMIAELDELAAKLDRAQAEIRALEDKLAKTDPWGDSQS